jgi:putative membrane protein
MNRILIRWVINVIALYVAVALLNGRGIIPQDSNWLAFIWLALIFGLVNAIVRPIIQFLTCPLIILTLGLGTLLINTLMFYLAGWIGLQFHVGFIVEGFWPAFLGAIIVSVVSFILSLFLQGELQERKNR